MSIKYFMSWDLSTSAPAATAKPTEVKIRPAIALHSTTRTDKWKPAEAMVAKCETKHFAGKHSEYDARSGVHSLKVVKGVSLIIPREFCPAAIEPPIKDCKCGIYAANNIAEAEKYGDIIGRVALWGTVVVSETGWRAQYAYPQALYVPDENLDDWRAQLAPYRVPVLKKSAIASMNELVAIAI